jgi:putative acetyltransferase
VTAGLRIALEDPAQPEVIQLLRDGEAHSAVLYPADSNHHLPLEALRLPEVRFLVAREAGRALGTGALVLKDDRAEIKRMWVAAETRGRGISKALLAALEAIARETGIRTLRLETGIANHEALGLYERAGFVRIPPFADYRPDPLSVFMAKAVSDKP